MLDGNQLHHLTSKFRNTPCQAVAAALTGVSPLNGDWTPEDNYWFNSRLNCQIYIWIQRCPNLNVIKVFPRNFVYIS